MAKPRIFVSSTYYDLKYVRERIERFISTYNFEPILFESDNVYFESGKPLDKSCYQEVKTCQMMLLIVGGRYGSLATEDQIDMYESEYVSITQKEYKTALQMGIPIISFIDHNVYTEYQTYKINKDKLPKKFSFAYVDNVKVFDFISSLEVNGAIKLFDKIEDIEHYFLNQVSGMLYDYLMQLQTKKIDDQILNSVSDINQATEAMSNIVNAIAEKVLGTDATKLIEEQHKTIIDFFIDLFGENVSFKQTIDEPSEVLVNSIAEAFFATIFNNQKLLEISKIKDPYESFQQYDNIVADLCNRINIIDQRLYSCGILAYKFKFKYERNIIKIIDASDDLKLYFENKLKSRLNDLITGLPF